MDAAVAENINSDDDGNDDVEEYEDEEDAEGADFLDESKLLSHLR